MNIAFANDQVRMTNAFRSNEREARANIEATQDQFWKEFWARQAYFWARQARWIEGSAI